MKWINCEEVIFDELKALCDAHLSKEPNNNRFLIMYEDGDVSHTFLGSSLAMIEKGGRIKMYLPTRRHPNYQLIRAWCEAVRPVYVDGIETENPLDALDKLSSVRLSIIPPEKKVTIKYRRYLSQHVSGSVLQEIVNYGDCVHLDTLEKSHEFIRWIDDDWVEEKVEV